MKIAVAHILKLTAQLLQKIKQKKAILTSNVGSAALMDVELLQEASDSVIKLLQAKQFKDELGKLKQKERSFKQSKCIVFSRSLYRWEGHN